MLFLALAGLPFSFRTVNLKNGVQKQPEHLAINRYGQVPVLRHRGLTLVMSNVILDYLARTTGHFEADDRAGPLACPRMAVLGERRHHQRGAGPPLPRFRAVDPAEIVDFFRPQAEAALDFIDRASEGRAVAGRRPLHHRRHRLLGPHGVHGRGRHVARQRGRTRAAWRDRIMAMPGFALPYDLIPKKDTEWPARNQDGTPGMNRAIQ